MSQNSKQKCRTCLKETEETYPLTKHVKGINPKTTYLQILKDYVRLKYPFDNEDVMPQNICRICSHKLKSIYKFIQQVQENSKILINTTCKPFDDCLQESVIDLPQDERDGNRNAVYEENVKLENVDEEYQDFSINDLNIDECNVDLESLDNVNKKELQIPESITNIFDLSFKANSNETTTNVLDNNEISFNTNKTIKNENIFKCAKCDYTAISRASLNDHSCSKLGADEKKLKCKFCAKRCVLKRDLLWHVKKTHNELIKSLKEEAESKKKRKSKPLPNIKTESIDHTFNDIIHDGFSSSSEDDYFPTSKSTPTKRENNEQELFSDEEFIREILDMKKVNLNKSLPRRCDECGQVYKNYNALYAHQSRVHVTEDEYCTCPHCSKKFKRKSNLKQHINNVHAEKAPKDAKTSKPKEKTNMCPECSHVCSTITALTIHRNRHHTGIKPYKCDFCPKAFFVAYDLKLHRYLHTGERPFTCPVCSKGFQDKAHLVKHERMHVSVPPNQCDECGKRFTQRYNLLAHQRLHLKQKNLNCNICNKVFKNKSLLNLHRIKENHQEEETNE